MGQIWSAHRALSNWDKEKHNIYIGSILVKNKNIPRFEETFGYLDYKWLLDVTRNRRCVYTEPVVNKYVTKDNLSLNREYRTTDFWTNVCLCGNDLAEKRIYGTRARYHYSMGEGKKARYYFIRANLELKTVLYYVTSYIPFVMRYVCRKFRVMG